MGKTNGNRETRKRNTTSKQKNNSNNIVNAGWKHEKKRNKNAKNRDI